MTRDEGRALATACFYGLHAEMFKRVKSIHIMNHLHEGHLTIRVFMKSKTAEDPEAMIFLPGEDF